MNNIFSIWSNSYLTQSKFFKDDFLEYFDYMNMEYNELDTLMTQFQNQSTDLKVKILVNGKLKKALKKIFL